MKTPGYFEFKHSGQSYFGVQSPVRGRRRSCIIIEDTPRPYLNWVLAIADRFDLQLITILPFSNDAIRLLKGETVQLGTQKPGPELAISDPSQCVVILDMHNDPERGQIFDGYDPAKPDQAGLAFWRQVPDSQGIHFLIASRFPEETFSDVGLTLNFTEIDKSQLMVNPNLPQHTVDQLNRKLGTLFSKADQHAQCDITQIGPTKYTIRYFNEFISSATGKAVARLYYLLRHQKISNNELCKLSGSPFLADDVDARRGSLNADGRLPTRDNATASGSVGGGRDSDQLKSRHKMLKETEHEHRKLQAAFEEAKRVATDRQDKLAELEQSLAKTRLEAEAHFQAEYGCGFSYGGVETHGDTVEEQHFFSDERERLEADHDRFQARMEVIVRSIQEIQDAESGDDADLAEMQKRLRAIGESRTDLWRQIHGKSDAPRAKGPKPDDTIRHDFLDDLRDTRGLYHHLHKAGASDALMQHFKDNIVSYGAGLQYIGTIEWETL